MGNYIWIYDDGDGWTLGLILNTFWVRQIKVLLTKGQQNISNFSQ